MTACTSADRFGTGASGAGAGAGTGGICAGSANDPTSSPLYFQQTIGDRVLFEVDQSHAGAAIETGPGRAGRTWLTTNTEYNAVIEGHADEQGTREYNLALGARRANAVREYLMSRGLAAASAETVSYGKERPIEVCSEEACYRQEPPGGDRSVGRSERLRPETGWYWVR